MRRFATALAAAILAAPPCLGGEPVETELHLRTQFTGGFGFVHHATLDALEVRPDDGKRHPLVLVNHGTTTDPAERHELSPSDLLPQAEEFVKRGWTAVIPMRRDYGKSGGEFAEDLPGQYCGQVGFEDAGYAAAADLKEVVRAVAGDPYIDVSKVMSVGVSGGGFASVALAAAPPPGLVAVINFAGGHGSGEQGMYCSFAELTQAFYDYGRKARVPALFVYAENDHFFGPRLAHDFYAAFVKAGGRGELDVAPPFGNEGHFLFTAQGAPIWTKYVDAFLAKHGLEAAPEAAAPVAQGGK